MTLIDSKLREGKDMVEIDFNVNKFVGILLLGFAFIFSILILAGFMAAITYGFTSNNFTAYMNEIIFPSDNATLIQLYFGYFVFLFVGALVISLGKTKE